MLVRKIVTAFALRYGGLLPRVCKRRVLLLRIQHASRWRVSIELCCPTGSARSRAALATRPMARLLARTARDSEISELGNGRAVTGVPRTGHHAGQQRGVYGLDR